MIELTEEQAKGIILWYTTIIFILGIAMGVSSTVLINTIMELI